MKSIFCLNFLVLVGCTTSYVVNPTGGNIGYVEFTEEVKGRWGTMEFADSLETEGLFQSVDSNVVQWTHPDSQGVVQISTKSLRRVVVKKHFLGALEGLGIGTGGGAVLGALAGWLKYSAATNKSDAGFGAGLYAAFATAGGLISGTIIGAILGHTDEFHFSAVQSRGADSR